MEEPATALVTPPNANPYVPAMQYTFAGGAAIATTVTQTPLLCANTSAPSAAGQTVNPVYYSPTGFNLTVPRPFVFGASSAAPAVSATASGATQVQMSPTSMKFDADSLGALVCYGLDANGVRRVTRDIFLDGLDGVPYNSTVTLSVFHIPQSQTDYYGYTVDVTLPALPVNTDDFALIEGFDSSIFATTAAESPSGLAGTWCQALSAGTSCSFAPNAGNLNFSYNASTLVNSSLQAPVSPNADVQYHFVVKRYLRNGVTLPLPSGPLAIAALFSPTDLEENKLDDNVSVGTNTLANAAPSVVTSGDAWTTFSNKLSGLVENTDSGTLSFSVSDPDTQGAFSATVTLGFPNGVSVTVPQTNCSSTNSGQGATGNCTLDIPLNNANWWNAAVTSDYQGHFNAVATDGTNGSYAPGVSASAKVVVHDALGKASVAVTVPIHVFSSVNNAPVVAYSAPFAAANDPNNNQSYPTVSCSVSAGSAAGGCGSANRFGQVEVDVLGAILANPAPAGAFDELATQSTAVVKFTDPNDAFTNVQCTKEQQSAIFATNGGPIVAAGLGSGIYDMNFVISSTPPASAVSALCTVTFTDSTAAFPNGETAKTGSSQFRLVVNP